jgi:hypothetical protein
MSLKSFILGVVVGAVAASILFGKINITIQGSDAFSTAFNIVLGAGLGVLAVIAISVLGIIAILTVLVLLNR